MGVGATGAISTGRSVPYCALYEAMDANNFASSGLTVSAKGEVVEGAGGETAGGDPEVLAMEKGGNPPAGMEEGVGAVWMDVTGDPPNETIAGAGESDWYEPDDSDA